MASNSKLQAIRERREKIRNEYRQSQVIEKHKNSELARFVASPFFFFLLILPFAVVDLPDLFADSVKDGATYVGACLLVFFAINRLAKRLIR